MSTYTNRGFLDLTNFEDRKAADVIQRKLKGHPEFICRKGDRLYFKFSTLYNKVNFFSSIRNMLTLLGYNTEVVDEVDYFELESIKKSSGNTVKPKKKRRSNYEMVTSARNKRPDKANG